MRFCFNGQELGNPSVKENITLEEKRGLRDFAYLLRNIWQAPSAKKVSGTHRKRYEDINALVTEMRKLSIDDSIDSPLVRAALIDPYWNQLLIDFRNYFKPLLQTSRSVSETISFVSQGSNNFTEIFNRHFNSIYCDISHFRGDNTLFSDEFGKGLVTISSKRTNHLTTLDREITIARRGKEQGELSGLYFPEGEFGWEEGRRPTTLMTQVVYPVYEDESGNKETMWALSLHPGSIFAGQSKQKSSSDTNPEDKKPNGSRISANRLTEPYFPIGFSSLTEKEIADPNLPSIFRQKQEKSKIVLLKKEPADPEKLKNNSENESLGSLKTSGTSEEVLNDLAQETLEVNIDNPNDSKINKVLSTADSSSDLKPDIALVAVDSETSSSSSLVKAEIEEQIKSILGQSKSDSNKSKAIATLLRKYAAQLKSAQANFANDELSTIALNNPDLFDKFGYRLLFGEQLGETLNTIAHKRLNEKEAKQIVDFFIDLTPKESFNLYKANRILSQLGLANSDPNLLFAPLPEDLKVNKALPSTLSKDKVQTINFASITYLPTAFLFKKAFELLPQEEQKAVLQKIETMNYGFNARLEFLRQRVVSVEGFEGYSGENLDALNSLISFIEKYPEKTNLQKVYCACLSNRARLLMGGFGSFEDALVDIEKFHQLTEKNLEEEVHFLKGQYYSRLNDTQKAVSHFKKAVSIEIWNLETGKSSTKQPLKDYYAELVSARLRSITLSPSITEQEKSQLLKLCLSEITKIEEIQRSLRSTYTTTELLVQTESEIARLKGKVLYLDGSDDQTALSHLVLGSAGEVTQGRLFPEETFMMAKILERQNKIEESLVAYKSIPSPSDVDSIEVVYPVERILLKEVLTKYQHEINDSIKRLESLSEVSSNKNVLSEDYELAREALESNDPQLAIEIINEARQKGIQDLELSIILGEAHEQQSNWSSAEEAYLEALRIEPNNPKVLNLLACSLIKQEKYREAQDNLHKSLQIETSAMSWCNLGSAYYLEGNSSEALKAYEAAIKLDKDNFRYFKQLAQCYMETEQYAKAVPMFQSAIELYEAEYEAELPNHIYLFHELAYCQAEEGDLISAEETCKKGLQVSPNDHNCITRLGMVYVNQANLLKQSGNEAEANQLYNKALEQYQAAAEIYYNDPTQHRMLGQLYYLAKNDGKKASQHLEKAIELGTKQGEDKNYLLQWTHELADIYSTTSRSKLAVNLLQDTLRKNPNSVETVIKLSQFYTPKEALELLLQALPKNSTNLELNVKLANAYKQNMDFDEAIKFYTKALEIDSNNLETLKSLAYIYLHQEELQKAKGFAERALKVAPDDIENLVYCGYIFNECKEYSRSIPILKKATELGPELASAWSNLGDSYKDTGKYAEASKCFKQALQYKPNDSDYLCGFGFCEMKIGNYRQAYNAYLKARFIANSDQTIVKQIKEVEEKIKGEYTAYEKHTQSVPSKISSICHDYENCFIAKDPIFKAAKEAIDATIIEIGKHLANPDVSLNYAPARYGLCQLVHVKQNHFLRLLRFDFNYNSYKGTPFVEEWRYSTNEHSALTLEDLINEKAQVALANIVKEDLNTSKLDWSSLSSLRSFVFSSNPKVQLDVSALKREDTIQIKGLDNKLKTVKIFDKLDPLSNNSVFLALLVQEKLILEHTLGAYIHYQINPVTAQDKAPTAKYEDIQSQIKPFSTLAYTSNENEIQALRSELNSAVLPIKAIEALKSEKIENLINFVEGFQSSKIPFTFVNGDDGEQYPLTLEQVQNYLTKVIGVKHDSSTSNSHGAHQQTSSNT